MYAAVCEPYKTAVWADLYMFKKLELTMVLDCTNDITNINDVEGSSQPLSE